MNTKTAARPAVALTPSPAPSAEPESSPAAVVGVRTTRIYCRPDCRPGRLPKPENRVPFASAAEARAAGYRPCKLCRPDDDQAPARGSRSRVGIDGPIRFGVGRTALGWLLVGRTDRGICALYLLDSDDPGPGLGRLRQRFPDAILQADPECADEFLPRVVAHVIEGRPCDDLPLDLHGTPFQLRVWEALRSIPRGRTMTYGELARALGLPPGAARAVGTACGSNSISLLVPCHRVVSSGGGLGGYYWGLDIKRALLDLEAVAPASD